MIKTPDGQVHWKGIREGTAYHWGWVSRNSSVQEDDCSGLASTHALAVAHMEGKLQGYVPNGLLNFRPQGTRTLPALLPMHGGTLCCSMHQAGSSEQTERAAAASDKARLPFLHERQLDSIINVQTPWDCDHVERPLACFLAGGPSLVEIHVQLDMLDSSKFWHLKMTGWLNHMTSLSTSL